MTNLFSLDLEILENGSNWIVGVDEVGRGPLAGPVTACAFAISDSWYSDHYENEKWAVVNDSKQLSEKKRLSLFSYAEREKRTNSTLIDYEVFSVSVEEIDKINILEATKLAMKHCLDALSERLSHLGCDLASLDQSDLFELGNLSNSRKNAQIIVDGRALKDFPYEHQNYIKGDGKSFAIAMASIMAKVTRDSLMDDLALEYPEYHWQKNKGYGTKVHRDALKEIGCCEHHRRSFLKKLDVCSNGKYK